MKLPTKLKIIKQQWNDKTKLKKLFNREEVPKILSSGLQRRVGLFSKWRNYFLRNPLSKRLGTSIEDRVKGVFNPTLVNNKRDLYLRWRSHVRRLLPLGGASEGNRLTLYSSGDDAFSAMFDAIASAQKRVWLETYIFEPGNIAKRVIAELAKAASRGVDVKLIYDYVGSQKLKAKDLEPLKLAGGQIIAFNPLISWPWRIHLGFWRNHKKILVVDDVVAFTGGMNIGDQYAGTKVGGNGFFRDAHAKVEGPAVHDLANMFVTSLRESGYSEVYDGSEDPPITPLTRRKSEQSTTTELSPSSSLRSSFVQILESNVRRNRMHIQKALLLTLDCATNYCYLTTPYFLPPQALKNALISAAERGVDVRILTAGMSDVPMVKLASEHVYELLIRNGVKIYELRDQALHAKTVTVDGTYSSIGSFNLDTWSYYYNLEINLTTLDHKMAHQLEQQFLTDLQNATRVTMADLENRSTTKKFIHWLIYHMLRVFSYNYFPFKVKALAHLPTRKYISETDKAESK